MSRIRWPKCWSISFRISPSNEYSGLIYFTTDGFDLLAVQGTLKSLLQHHSSKASSLQFLAFFMVQLSHPYMTIGKTIALTRQTFVGKAMSLLFNMLSRLVPEWSSGFPHFLQFKSEFGNRSSWSEPQSGPCLVFADCIELLHPHSSKASVLWHSAFFIVQLSHPYMTTGKTVALTRCTFVGKVMSLLF